MHPIICERHAVAALGLSDLILVVRKLKILSAAVYVDRRSEMSSCHRRAFYVPSGVMTLALVSFALVVGPGDGVGAQGGEGGEEHGALEPLVAAVGDVLTTDR